MKSTRLLTSRSSFRNLENADQMATELEIFRQFLKGKQLKVTPEREAILRLVFGTHEHFDAEELLLDARGTGQRVSKATIYRTLDLLVESGLLTKHIFNGRHSRYEHIYGHKNHEHMFCVSCHRIFEFTVPDLDRIQDEIAVRFNFRPLERSLQISGYCSRCTPVE